MRKWSVPILLSFIFCLSSSPCFAQTTDNLTWMLSYRDKGENALTLDNRFPAFLRDGLPAISLADWNWSKKPVNEVATDFFPGVPGLLEVRNGRYLSFSGCPAHACEDRALVWTDLESKIVVFVATGDEAQNFARETRIQYPIQSAKLFLATKADLLPAKLPDELSTSVLRWLHLEGVLRLDGVTLTTPTGIEPVTTDQIQWTGRFGKPDIF